MISVMRQVDFIVFTKDFARFRLAEYFHIPPADIQVHPLQKGSNIYMLEHSGASYIIKFSSPVYYRKDAKKPLWDFDIRDNVWANGKNKKLPVEAKENLYYLFIGLENNLPKKFFLVSSNEVPKNHVRILLEGKSKYHKYEI